MSQPVAILPSPSDLEDRPEPNLSPQADAGQEGRQSKPIRVSVVIPAYNEENGITDVVNQVGDVMQRSGFEYEIIIIDDGSTDDTANVAERTPARVIRHSINRGYGAALKTGIRNARYELICITDADGTYPPENLPAMILDGQAYDMVVGARTGKEVQIPMVRRPAKWILNQLANFLTATKIPDLNSGLRVLQRDLVVDYLDILPERFSFTTTITLASLCDGYNVKFTPIEYRKRVGNSKIKPIDALNFLILILRTMTYFRPLRIFVPIALGLFLLGFIKLVIDISYLRITPTSAMLLLGGLQLIAIGVVADLICFVRRRRPRSAKPVGPQTQNCPGR